MSAASTKMGKIFSRKRAPGALFVLAAMGLSQAAFADDFHATRSDLLVEKSHRIEVRLGRGHADLVVRRTAHNGGPRHDQATYYINVPEGAVAVGLRTLGLLDGKPHWFDGELMEAEAAAAKYRELTGIGGYYPKDPALLSWRSQDLLALQVFPCAPGEDKTVEYTLRMPATYSEGKWHIDLGSVGTSARAAEATILPMEPGDALFLANKPVRAPAWATLKESLDIAIAPAFPEKLSGATAMLSVSKQKHLSQMHFEAAARLGEVPRNAHVVVLLDASRSLSDDETKSEIAMAKAYLSSFSDGKAAILPFDRKVQKNGFVGMAQARAMLGALTLERKNGSHLDEALKTADAMLAALPSSTPKRIVLLTDTLVRSELSPEVLRGKLQKSGALLHIGVLGNTHQTEIARDDDHAFAVVARPTGGLVWRASIEESDEAALQKEVFEEWARPKRIDHLVVKSPGLDENARSFPSMLREGEGLEDARVSEKPVSFVEITGELWATPIKRVLVPNEKENQRFASLVFGSSMLYDLSEEEMMPLALLGKAVSPVTSYLAIEPGVRPSTEGLEEMSGTGSGFGSGVGRLNGSHGIKPVFLKTFDPQAFLTKALQSALEACGGKGRKVQATLESTLAELVSVKTTIEGEKSDSKLSLCLEEGTWAVELPGAFDALQQSFHIRL